MRWARVLSPVAAFALLQFPVQSRADDWLDGTWEGAIKIEPGSRPFDTQTEQKIRIQVIHGVAHVFVYVDGKMVARTSEAFTVARKGETALIYTSDHNDVWPDKEQTETVSYAVALLGNNDLLVEYARVGETMVGEIMAEGMANFGEHGEGELKPVGN
ncbi:MAG TPA: hypothetical protein VHZ78_08340 [Rhizomicrobium sp.]|jgi:hypothetical protein|nr:hypothetical protein [Rhizomicrobium sp.]